MAIGYYIFQDDKTSCGGVVTEGIPDHTHFDRLQACEEHNVTCGKHPGLYKIMGGLPNDFIHDRRIAGTLHSRSTCLCRAEFIPSIFTDTYEFIPRDEDSGRNTDDPDSPLKPGPRVFAKSCLRPAGCTDAGTEDEPQENVGEMAFYVSVPASEEDRESARRAWVEQQRMAMSAPPEKSLFDKVSGFFFGEAQAFAIPMPPPPPVTGGGNSNSDVIRDANNQIATQLTTATRRLGDNRARKQQEILLSLPWMLMGAMVYDKLKGHRSDLLTPEKLLEVAIGKGTVPTRVRYRWEEDPETGRLKAVGYHTSPGSGRDQVKVRLLRKNINGGYDFWGDERMKKPLITWTPADAPGRSDSGGWHTGNDSTPVSVGVLPGLEYPDIEGVKILTTPVPEERDFRDYILVFPGNEHPPIYVYLSKPPVEFLDVAPYRDFNGRSRQGLYHVDHMPSRQAVILYLRRERPNLNQDQVDYIADQVAAIGVPEKVHRRDSATYGGRNRSQMGPDSYNLRAAIDKDFDKIKPVLMQEYGAKETQLEAARTEMHRINTELGLYK